MYVIMGASGNTGKPIAQALLEAGKQVRVLGRNADKLKNLAENGAEVQVGDILEAGFLEKSFSGATAVYALIPPNFNSKDYRAYQNSVALAIKKALEVSQVKYVVTLSSVGAHLPENGGIVQGLYHMEKLIDKIVGLNVLHLRPAFFLENLLSQVATVKQMGVMASPVKADVKTPMVATKDIAVVATKRLLALDFQGTANVQYILGERDISYNEIAAVFGEAIGKPDLQYVQTNFEDMKQAMVHSWGVTEDVADQMNQLMENVNNGRLLSDIKRTPQSTTTSIEDFSQIFAHVYQNS